MVIAHRIEKIKELSDSQSEQVFGIIEQKIMEKGSFENKPDGIEGLKKLVQHKALLRKRLADFIVRLPKAKVGVWVINGWNDAIPNGCREYDTVDKYLKELKLEGSPIVQQALKSIGRKE